MIRFRLCFLDKLVNLYYCLYFYSVTYSEAEKLERKLSLFLFVKRILEILHLTTDQFHWFHLSAELRNTSFTIIWSAIWWSTIYYLMSSISLWNWDLSWLDISFFLMRLQLIIKVLLVVTSYISNLLKCLILSHTASLLLF